MPLRISSLAWSLETGEIAKDSPKTQGYEAAIVAGLLGSYEKKLVLEDIPHAREGGTGDPRAL